MSLVKKCLVTLAAVAMSSAAHATTVMLDYIGLQSGTQVNISYSYTGTNGTVTGSGGGGIFMWNKQGGGSLKTFCTQLSENTPGNNPQFHQFTQVGLAQVPESINPANEPNPGPMGALKATVIRDLYARHYQNAINGGEAAKLFQLAIWLITHNALNAQAPGFNLKTWANSLEATDATQNFYFTGGVGNAGNANSLAAKVNNWLDGLGTGGWLSYGVAGLQSATLQDQLVVIPVPAPALLAGLGLIGAVAVRRRMTKA